MKCVPLVAGLLLLCCTVGAAPIVESTPPTDGLDAKLGGTDPFTTTVHRAGSRVTVTGAPYVVSSPGIADGNGDGEGAGVSASELEGLAQDATVQVASNLPSLATFADTTKTNREEMARRIGNRVIDEQTPREEDVKRDPQPGVVTILNVLFGVGILVILLAKFRNG